MDEEVRKKLIDYIDNHKNLKKIWIAGECGMSPSYFSQFINSTRLTIPEYRLKNITKFLEKNDSI